MTPPLCLYCMRRAGAYQAIAALVKGWYFCSLDCERRYTASGGPSSKVPELVWHGERGHQMLLEMHRRQTGRA